jgi:hypothetical protein
MGFESRLKGVADMNLRTLQIVLGLACTFIFLALALYRVPLPAIGAVIAGSNPALVPSGPAFLGSLRCDCDFRPRVWDRALFDTGEARWPIVPTRAWGSVTPDHC